jgi:outer membrane protein assembly factor BamB
MGRSALTLSALFCVCLLVETGSAAELAAKSGGWPQWRGPERNGLSSETGLNTDWKRNAPGLLWTVEGLGEGFASVSIADGRIFTTGNLKDGQGITAMKESDGSQLWRKTLTSDVPKHGYPGSRCTPAIDGDRLYVVLSDGTLACLKTADGETVWRKDFKKDFGGKMMSGWGYSESPLIDGPWVLCTPGGKDAMIVALDKMTGDEIWRTAMPEKVGDKGGDGAAYSSIVISNGAGVKQYVQLVGRGVIGVRASDGKLLWGYNTVANSTANIPTPVIAGDHVFCSTGYGTGSALLKLSAVRGGGVRADEVYFLDAKTLQNHHGGMLLVGDHIYCGHAHNQGFPICVAIKTGEVVWGGKRGPGSGSAAVTFYDGHIIFRFQSGDVALIQATPEGYRIKGQFKPDYIKGPSWAHPVVADGRLYLREQDKLMCYDLR